MLRADDEQRKVSEREQRSAVAHAQLVAVALLDGEAAAPFGWVVEEGPRGLLERGHAGLERLVA